MKRIIITNFLLLISVVAFGQIDTLYYSKEWKGVEHKVFATYFRIIPSNYRDRDPNSRKPFRDFYSTGELESEGYFISIDKDDDTNSIFDGEYVSYYKNGKISRKGQKEKGVQQGEYIEYTEDGLIALKSNYKDGKLDGLYTKFSDNGEVCIQVEYSNGKPINDWMMATQLDGLCSKVRIDDGTPIYDSPDDSEKNIEYYKGKKWIYFNKNGIIIGMTNSKKKDYGKWYQIEIIIGNYSLFPIEFNPKDISSVLVYNTIKNKKMSLKVYSSDEYIDKVERTQYWEMELSGLALGLSAAAAGYSVSTSNSSYSGSSSEYGTASVYGSDGYASGNYSGNSYYSGSSTTVTRTYDEAAAYRARIIANDSMAEYEDKLLSDKNAKEEGYLKRSTIHPGETISGYINIERKEGQELTVYIKIQDAVYPFIWDLNEGIKINKWEDNIYQR